MPGASHEAWAQKPETSAAAGGPSAAQAPRPGRGQGCAAPPPRPAAAAQHPGRHCGAAAGEQGMGKGGCSRAQGDRAGKWQVIKAALDPVRGIGEGPHGEDSGHLTSCPGGLRLGRERGRASVHAGPATRRGRRALGQEAAPWGRKPARRGEEGSGGGEEEGWRAWRGEGSMRRGEEPRQCRGPAQMFPCGNSERNRLAAGNIHELYGKRSPGRRRGAGHPDQAGEKGHGGTRAGVACPGAVF